MKLYKDRQLTEETGQSLEFGRVMVGESKDYHYWVHNEDKKVTLVQIQFLIDHDEIIVVEAPERIIPLGIEKLILRWTPKIQLREPLTSPVKVIAVEEFIPQRP